MDFLVLINQLKKLNLHQDKYVVVSSGALAARGIREAKDLDILVTEDLFNELAQIYKITQKDARAVIEVGDLEIMGKGSLFTDGELVPIEEIIKTADIVDGTPFMNLELLKQFKAKMGRDKDLKDVQLIEEYQNKMI